MTLITPGIAIAVLITAIILFIGKEGGAAIDRMSRTPGEDSIISIEINRTVSPAGAAKVTMSVHYKKLGKYGAIVECEALKDSVYLVAKSIRDLQRDVDKAFADYDMRARGS